MRRLADVGMIREAFASILLQTASENACVALHFNSGVAIVGVRNS